MLRGGGVHGMNRWLQAWVLPLFIAFFQRLIVSVVGGREGGGGGGGRVGGRGEGEPAG